MMSCPLVSVYLPTFNRCQLLRRAVESVLSQSYQNIELIIVDDGSTDSTLDYLERLSHEENRVKVLHKKDFGGKRGGPASRNIAIRESRGKYVTGLDDDDYFHVDRVSCFLKAYSPGYSCLASNYYRLRKHEKKGAARSSLVGRVVSYSDLFDGNCLGSQVFVERKRILKAGLFDEDLKASQDLDMWLRIIKIYGNALRLRAPLYYMDTSHDSERITDSVSRVVGTQQFLQKHQAEMSSCQIEYRLDSMGESRKSGYAKLFKLKKYGYKITANIIRAKLNIF